MGEAAEHLARPFVLEGWRVEPMRLVLVDEEGQEHSVSQRAMSVLVELARADGEVVRKYDLMSAVWGQAEVGDGALSQAIFELRHVFGDDPKHPAMIETIRGLGFRLIAAPAPIEPRAAAPEQAASPGIHALAVLAAVVALTAVTGWLLIERPDRQVAGIASSSIAVLPILVDGPDAIDWDIAKNIHEDLVMHIARIPGIRSVTGGSLLHYQDSEETARQIAEELGVETLLMTQAQTTGDTLHLDVELVSGSDERSLWTARFSAPNTVMGQYALPGDVTRELASQFGTDWPEVEREAVLSAPSRSLEALEAFVRWRDLKDDKEPNRRAEALSQLERAVDLDPAFALARTALADQYISQIWNDVLPREDLLAKAEPLLRSSLKLDPLLPLTYVVLANLEQEKGNVDAAAIAYRQAIELDPNFWPAHDRLGALLMWEVGDTHGAIRHWSITQQLNPRARGHRLTLASAWARAGRIEEAREEVEKIIRELPDWAEPYRTLSGLFANRLGRGDLAIQALRRYMALNPHSPQSLREMGNLYADLGDRETAILWWRRAINGMDDTAYQSAMRGYIARARGDTVTASAEFSSVPRQPSFLFHHAQMLLSEIEWRSGRSEAAWQRIAALHPELMQPDPVINDLNVVAAGWLIYLGAETGHGEDMVTLSNRLFAALRNIQVLQAGITPALLHLVNDDRERALDALESLVDAGEHRDWYPRDFFSSIGSEPEFQRLWALMESRRTEQRANLERLERNELLAPLPRPVLALDQPEPSP